MNISNDTLTAAERALISDYEVRAEVLFAELVKYPAQHPRHSHIDMMERRRQVHYQLKVISEDVAGIRRHARSRDHQSLAARLAEHPKTAAYLIAEMLRRIDELETRVAKLEGKAE